MTKDFKTIHKHIYHKGIFGDIYIRKVDSKYSVYGALFAPMVMQGTTREYYKVETLHFTNLVTAKRYFRANLRKIKCLLKNIHKQ